MVPESETVFQQAVENAKKAPVRVSAPNGSQGVLLSGKALELFRREIGKKLLEALDDLGKEARQAGFSEEDMKALFPDHYDD